MDEDTKARLHDIAQRLAARIGGGMPVQRAVDADVTTLAAIKRDGWTWPIITEEIARVWAAVWPENPRKSQPSQQFLVTAIYRGLAKQRQAERASEPAPETAPRGRTRGQYGTPEPKSEAASETSEAPARERASGPKAGSASPNDPAEPDHSATIGPGKAGGKKHPWEDRATERRRSIDDLLEGNGNEGD